MKLIKPMQTGILKRTVLAVAGLLLSANLMAQDKPVSLPARTLTLSEAFAQIEKQTGYIIAYSGSEFDVNRPVTVAKSEGTTKDILTLLLADTGQVFNLSGNHIFLKAEPVNRTTASKPIPVTVEPVPDKVQGISIPTVTQSVAVTPVEEPVPAPKGNYSTVSNLRETPHWALKTNLLLDATASIALGVEFRTSSKTTLDISGSYRSWDFHDTRRFRYILVQPEFRLWTCEAFRGHFFGLHAHWADYNVGGWQSPPFSSYMNTHQFEGWLAGAGVSYGYHWILGNRWSLEATIGVGYAYMKYDVYPCETCGKKITNKTKNYFGPTKAGVTLIFMIK